ncbi:hypothetical protein [Methanovulcanius yangii]|uniref:hypothetical protein n=1 Tax=Methanovulcanius yangii TaxID=1789227 RepID=UPI0029CA22E8|nr:hypothetical protein [Methanovulcanius yangii]
MVTEYEINSLILETIDEHCTDPQIRKLIREAMRYEIDMYHRNPRPADIEAKYLSIIDRIYREVL